MSPLYLNICTLMQKKDAKRYIYYPLNMGYYLRILLLCRIM
nr:MAG TPA: hypothetical protein [Caudoviricetes sp.]